MVDFQEPIGLSASAHLEKICQHSKSKLNCVSLGLAFLGVVFFLLYSTLVFSVWLPQLRETGQSIQDWPDATANQTFVNTFIETSRFSKAVPQNIEAGDVIYPRSTKVVRHQIVPMSFLGLPIIYGWLGKIVGSSGVFFLTPFFAILGVLFFYALIKKVFNRAVAGWSALLLFTLSVYWYYSTQVFLPNILFISLLLVGIYLIIYKKINEHFWGLSFSAGAFLIGLALAVRAVEAPWVLLMLLILLFSYDRKKWWVYVLLFILFFSLAFLPVLYFNHQLYGEYFTVGYLKINPELNLLARVPTAFKIDTSITLPGMAFVKVLILPFGLNVLTLFRNVYRYIFVLMAPYLILAVLGWVCFLFCDKKNKKQWVYVLIALTTASWLVFYYGNWLFEDKNVLKYNLIGSSYTRYWLPLYILFLPFIGYLFEAVKTKLRQSCRSLVFVVTVIITLCLAGYSYLWVYKSPYDGLDKVKQNLLVYSARYQTVRDMVEPNALLITDRTDKIFFPKYDVIVFLLDYTIFPRLKPLVGTRPIYYLTQLPDNDIKYINDEKIKELGLKFVNPTVVDSEYRLFEMVRL